MTTEKAGMLELTPEHLVHVEGYSYPICADAVKKNASYSSPRLKVLYLLLRSGRF